MAEPRSEQDVTGLIGWFAKNQVAANLLMISIIILGLYGVFTIKKETFPEFVANQISVQVPYLGGAPEEVERGVVLKIEEAMLNPKLATSPTTPATPTAKAKDTSSKTSASPTTTAKAADGGEVTEKEIEQIVEEVDEKED